MDRILNHIYRIDNHPVAGLPEVFRIRYVKGLGACLYVLSRDSAITRMLFLPWAKSIVGDVIEGDVYWCEDVEASKVAVGIQHRGLSVFYMKYAFFFDVFFLLRESGLPHDDEAEVYDYLRKRICGWWSRWALKGFYDYWSRNGACPKQVDSVLVGHKRLNEVNLERKEKRVLVVANVSAGKSTLINALTGWRVNRTRSTACTDRLIYLHNKRVRDGVSLRLVDGTYGYFDNAIGIDVLDVMKEVAFPFGSSLGKEAVCFIDTPGVNNAVNGGHRALTEKAVREGEYEAVLYVSNSLYFGTNDERALLEFLHEQVKKPIIFVLNQLDNFVPEEDSIAGMVADYKADLKGIGFEEPVVVPVSAYAAFLFRMDAALLTGIENRKRGTLEEVFGDDYYDLPSYVTGVTSSDLLARTGIIELENKILEI